MKKIKEEKVHWLNRLLQKRLSIIILLGLVLISGLPLRIQNLKLDGYISDDAWWHYRQINEIVLKGKRLNPDIYEFTTLNRPMTYSPFYHYFVANFYKLFSKASSLVKFTHYFNILEGLLYILLIYLISYLFTRDKLFSLLGAQAASVSYGIIIRARAGELMPFVLADLLSLAAAALLIVILRNINHPRRALYAVFSGVLFGLAMLSWSGTALIYAPLIFFAFIPLIFLNPKSIKLSLELFLLCLLPFLAISLPWYLPIVSKYGLNPHSPEMSWFMEKFTVLRQVKPLPFYIFTSGPAIFFIPIAMLILAFKRNALNIFFILWIILGGLATYTGWRGYVAVVPVISAIALSIAASRIIRFIFKDNSPGLAVLFAILFLIVAGLGYRISALRIKPLDPNNPMEVRTNAKGIKMLEYLKTNYPQAVAIDHITWISEDAAVGNLRMVAGQYLEYMPKGSGEALKDTSRAYLCDEENAYQIFRKYNADLIIVRRQIMEMAQLSILFAPPELKNEEYMRVFKEDEQSTEVTINFTAKGRETMLFRMLSRQPLNHFELIYSDQNPGDSLPFVVVYKVKREL